MQRMSRIILRAIVVFVASSSVGLLAQSTRRGDVNQDGLVDLSDVIGILRSLYGLEYSPCLSSADANADGSVDITDVVNLSQQVFLGREETVSLSDGDEEPCADALGEDPLEEDAEGGGGGSALMWQDLFDKQPLSGQGRYIFSAPTGAIQATRLSGRTCLMIRCDAGQTRDQNGRVRSELTRWDPLSKSKIFLTDPIGSERWYAFSVFVPTSWMYDVNKVHLVQWHGSEDPGETGFGRNPPLTIMIVKSQLVIRQLWSARRIQSTNENRADIWKGSLEKGKWIQFVFHMKWSYKSDGFLDVWKNGTRIINQRNRPNCYNDAIGPYFKLGLYWPSATYPGEYARTDRHVAYYDSFRVGSRSNILSDMTP
jgi:hypothetical protein